MGSSRLWLPTATHRTFAPLPNVKVTGSGTLASGPSRLNIPCASPKTAEKPRYATLRRLTFTRKCVKMVPLTKVFSSKLSSSSFPSSSHSPSRGAANVVKRDVTGELPQRIDSGSSVSSCEQPLPAEPPPPYQLRVANPAPASFEYDYDYDHNHGRGRAAATAMSSSSRFTTASIEAIRAPDSPVPTFPSPKLSTESVFGSTQSPSSLASISDTESAPTRNGTGIISDEPRRYGDICSLRNFAARGAGPAPALRRKNTIGFARRVHTALGPRTTASSAPF